MANKRSKALKIIEPPVIVVFGVTGDLSKRKLLPALYHLLRHSVLPASTTIVGVSRRPLAVEKLLEKVELCVLEKDKVCDPDGLKKTQDALQTFQLQPDSDDDFIQLKTFLDRLDGKSKRNRLFYMSTPSDAYSAIVKKLGEHGLNDSRTKLLLEKPFGHDLDSAKKLIKVVHAGFKENQIYRIDHYLAKETAQNLLAFRMHNPIFQSLWDDEHISQVTIRAYEEIGIEKRANFYERTGALRDLIQSHLIQLLCITLMDTPEELNTEDIHKQKQDFLKNLKPASPNQALRGQYRSYKSEVKNTKSFVETFAEIQLSHSSKKWNNTKLVLSTGKGLQEKITEIVIEFNTDHETIRNKLIFQIQPEEGIHLELAIKEPGFETLMKNAELYLEYQNSFKKLYNIDAYERVLFDALRNDQSLFASDSEVLSSWKIIEPVLDKWQASGRGLKIYNKGASPNSIISGKIS